MGTFYNGASCDIYIGAGAGKKLLQDISEAKKSVKIISPYLSPYLVEKLINIHEKGVSVKLITSDNIEDFTKENKKNIYKLIIQHKIKDIEAELSRNRLIEYSNLILYITIGISLGLLLLVYFFKKFELLYGSSIVFIFLLLRSYFTYIVKNKRVHTYKYSQLFPFKVFISDNNNPFIHSKIYIIDDKIVYLGSLNFTASGTKYNYEARIRTKDAGAVRKIIDEFNSLFSRSDLPERNIQNWGRFLYSEPNY